jgi:hypothetical protein
VTGGEKLLLVGAAGLGVFAFLKARSGSAAPTGVTVGSPAVTPPLPKGVPGSGSFLYSSGIPGSSRPYTFAGQTQLESNIALKAGAIAPFVAGKIPIFGTAASYVAGPDTTVNVAQTERNVHAVAEIVTGHPVQGVKDAAGAAVTVAVQPLKSAANVGKKILTAINPF